MIATPPPTFRHAGFDPASLKALRVVTLAKATAL